MDWFCLLPEKRIVDDSIFSWVAGFEEAVSTEFFDYEKENSGIENPAKHLKTEAGNTDVKKLLTLHQSRVAVLSWNARTRGQFL